MRILKIYKRGHEKTRGQSLVEFTIMLPVVLILLSGVIEFGFLLNYYLDIIDAARETARFAANDDPIRDDATGNPLDPNPGFYDRAQDLAKQSLNAASDGRIQWPEFAPEPFDCSSINGDVVLSAFAISGASVDTRYPAGGGEGGVSMCGNYNSKMTSSDVNSIIGGSGISNTGFILVEIFYDYDQTLGLPWITAVVPDPVPLYAYSIMPNVNIEPTATPLGAGPPPPATNTPGPAPTATDTPSGPTATATNTLTNTPTATATLPGSCSDIFIDSFWISGDDLVASVVNNNAVAATLTDTTLVWEEMDPSMYVDRFEFGPQYYGGDDYSSPTVVSGSSATISGSSTQTWRMDFDGEPYEPINGSYSLTLTFDVPGAGGPCVTSDSISSPTPTATPAPSCSDIYISSMWISGDDVRATVQNDNDATAYLTDTAFTWNEMSGSMRVDYFNFNGSEYYGGNDYSSPTNHSGSNVSLSGTSSATWRTDFDGEPYEPIDGTYSLTLTFNFPGWGTCDISDSVTG